MKFYFLTFQGGQEIGRSALRLVVKCNSLFLFLLITNIGFSQTISGTINSYLRVTALNNGTRTFTSDNLSGSIADFAAGKTVIIYQARGATIDATNTSTYGAITAFNSAGYYEFAIVSSITGSGPYTIVMTSLTNSYSATDYVQLISVPKYNNVTVNGTVTSIPWNSTQGRGGVVAMEVTSVLTLSANIDVTSQGFAGGVAGGNNGGCSDNTTYVTTDGNYGQKGEGVTDFSSGNFYGRGPQANGGGGGNPHNAGGGGGSNFTQAGAGGQGWTGACGFVNSGGVSGSKTFATNRIFFGGGGGAGQQNDNVASSGGAGGGIIIIRANTITSSCAGTYSILANGQSASNSFGNDGAGGGGAGGTIVLDVLNYNLPSCAITVSAHGGGGGTVNDSAGHGGGGGGGIGVIMEVNPTSNANVTLASTPGNNGQDCTTCTVPSGAAPETPTTSKVGIGTISGILTPLPIELLFFTGNHTESGVQLRWTTASEKNNDFFTVERSANGFDFTPIRKVNGKGTTSDMQHYSITDGEVVSSFYYYRLKQTDYDGRSTYSKIIYIEIEHGISPFVIFPNPAYDRVTISNPTKSHYTVRLINNRGVEVFLTNSDNGESLDIFVSDFIKGLYLVEIADHTRRFHTKLVIE